VSVVQLTDTHIVRDDARSFGIDTARYLQDAIAAINALDPKPEYAVVTGDVANFGTTDEYARFRDIMEALEIPYVAIPGNHDDRDRMREVLPPHTFRGASGASGASVRFAVDEFSIRLIGLDANAPRPWPGAYVDRATTDWLDRILGERPQTPTIVAVHQPPFRTGLHYLDVLGFVGSRGLRAVVDRHPQVARVISGHIHCVRSARWKGAIACSAPSTAPQKIPLLFMERQIVGIRSEAPGFALHALGDRGQMKTTVYRRDETGRYAPA
jgi:3',5'-cyclic AMP phosphodiesterase CpdA